MRFRDRRVTTWTLVATALMLFAVREVACSHASRARGVSTVEHAKLYRCGQPSTSDLGRAIERDGIRTVVNLRGGHPNPALGSGWREKEFCQKHGVRYVHLVVRRPPSGFPTIAQPHRPEPAFVREFLRLVQDSAAQPILMHCHAGENRTGFLVAVYRIVCEHWSAHEAYAEMVDYGFDGEKSDIWPYLEFLDHKSNDRIAKETEH